MLIKLSAATLSILLAIPKDTSLLIDNPSREENNNVILLRVASYYGDNGNVSDFPADSRLLVCLHLHSDAENYADRERGQPPFRDEAALFCALGWYVHSNETRDRFIGKESRKNRLVLVVEKSK
jgi:hypothetical protein